MNISLTVSDIRLNISPGIIDLLNKAMATFASNALPTNLIAHETDYSELWTSKAFRERDHWFMRVDSAEEALWVQNVEVEALPEVCIVEMPSIVVVVETGFGYYTQPMLHLKSCMHAEIRDWSSDVSKKRRS